MGLSREIWIGNANLGIPKSGPWGKDSEMEICGSEGRRTMSMEEMDSSGTREVLHSSPALGQMKQSLVAPNQPATDMDHMEGEHS